jgi:serine protein kinase
MDIPPYEGADVMGEQTRSFEEVIKTDRALAIEEEWTGTFLEYLEKVKVDPNLSKLSHSRIYDLIVARGVNEIPESEHHTTPLEGTNKVYKFFSDEFFGIEKVCNQIVRYFHSAALKGEESRQVLYLMGPVGSGKTSLVEKIESALEEGPPFFAIDGCPMHEEPLHLIPRHLRKEFEKMLGVHIEGELCPVCRFRLYGAGCKVQGARCKARVRGGCGHTVLR